MDRRGALVPDNDIFLFGDTNAGSEIFLIGGVDTSVDIDLSLVTGESGSPVILLFMLLLKEFRAEIDLDS